MGGNDIRFGNPQMRMLDWGDPKVYFDNVVVPQLQQQALDQLDPNGRRGGGNYSPAEQDFYSRLTQMLTGAFGQNDGTRFADALMQALTGRQPPPRYANPAGVNPANVNPANVNPANVNPANVNPANVNPANVNPANVNPANVNPANVNPANVNPANVNPANVNPANVNPANVNPANVNPANVNPANVNPANVNGVPGRNYLPYYDPKTGRLDPNQLSQTFRGYGVDPQTSNNGGQYMANNVSPQEFYQPMWNSLGGRGQVDLDQLGRRFAPVPQNAELKDQIRRQQIANASNGDPSRRRFANVNPANVNPANVNPANVNPANVNPANVNPANVNPANVNPANVNPANVNPANVNPANVNPANVNPANVNPANVNPANVNPANVNPANVNPANVNPANVNPANTNPANVNPPNVRPPVNNPPVNNPPVNNPPVNNPPVITPPVNNPPRTPTALTLNESQNRVIGGLHGNGAKILDSDGDGKVNAGDIVQKADGTKVTFDQAGAAEFNQRANLVAVGLSKPEWKFNASATPVMYGNGVFGGTVQENDYWKTVTTRNNAGKEFSYLAVKDGVKPADAVEDMRKNASKYGFDCATSIRIADLVAAKDTLGPDQFNKNFNNLWIHSNFDSNRPPYETGDMRTNATLGEAHTSRDMVWTADRNGPTTRNGERGGWEFQKYQPGGNDQLKPGDWRYYEHPGDVTSASQGWNVIYLGENPPGSGKHEFWKVGSSNTFTDRKPGETGSALSGEYLSDVRRGPDGQYIAQMQNRR